jgi:sugar/nucleoside kinase (ribokinase family)
MEVPLQKRLLQTLEHLRRKDLPLIHVVMLPDFFLDHVVSLDAVEKTCTVIRTLAAQGGGNYPGSIQRIHQGGNAANTALGLARLGVSAHLICQTDPLGLHLLHYFLGRQGVDLSGVKTDGALAKTTALEFRDHGENIMIGDPGSVARFAFELLTDRDLELIASANLVGVTNWNLNRCGTDLACRVFDRAKHQNVRTFFDSGDPSPRKEDIPELVTKVLMNPQLDIFGLNENELNYFSGSSNKTQVDMLSAITSLKLRIPARIDFHTALFSGTVQSETTVVPTIPVSRVYRSTGAGDAWNAANIFADLCGFADDERLLFANLCAGLYISSSDAAHSTIDMVINYIKKSL